jgi:hypothetical protein
VDDPVGRVDPEGLETGFLDSLKNFYEESGLKRKVGEAASFIRAIPRALDEADEFKDEMSQANKPGVPPEQAYGGIIDAFDRQQKYYRETVPELVKDGFDLSH